MYAALETTYMVLDKVARKGYFLSRILFIEALRANTASTTRSNH